MKRIKKSLGLLITIVLFSVSISGCGKKISNGNVFEQIRDEKKKTEVETEDNLLETGNKENGREEAEETDPLLKEQETYYDYLEKKSAPDVLDYFDRDSGDFDHLDEMGYVIIKWDEVLHLERYWQFEYKYQIGQPADLVLVQYTDNDEPYIDYLYYDGKEVLHVRDYSKVTMDTNSSYSETMPYLIAFEQRAEENDRYKTLVLSEKEDLSYDEFEKMYYQAGDSDEMSFIGSFFYVDGEQLTE